MTEDAERAALQESLANARRLVAWKLEGIDDGRAADVATPSGMTARGIVQHLKNVEMWWLRHVFAGEDGVPFDSSRANPDGQWRPPRAIPTADLVAAYLDEGARSDAIIAAHALDDLGSRQPVSLRWVLVHLIEETGRHLGHLDLLRERADGAVGVAPGWGAA